MLVKSPNGSHEDSGSDLEISTCKAQDLSSIRFESKSSSYQTSLLSLA